MHLRKCFHYWNLHPLVFLEQTWKSKELQTLNFDTDLRQTTSVPWTSVLSTLNRESFSYLYTSQEYKSGTCRLMKYFKCLRRPCLNSSAVMMCLPHKHNVWAQCSPRAMGRKGLAPVVLLPPVPGQAPHWSLS